MQTTKRDHLDGTTEHCFTAYSMALGDSFAYVFVRLFFLKKSIPFYPNGNWETSTVLDWAFVLESSYLKEKEKMKKKKKKVTRKIIMIPRIIIFPLLDRGLKKLACKGKISGETPT